MANIVICADGTWNRPEEDLSKDYPTNVLKMARAICPEQDGQKQHVFYDWGLGSYHNSFSAGATGSGIHKNILDGYRYLVQNYQQGDRIYLFGFSRGAYTVRALSGLINNCGIIRRADANLINEAWKIYKSPSKKNHPRGEAAVEFRKAHCHASKDVHFIGVWDTVGALGIPFSLMGLFDSNDEFYDTKMGSNVKFARHALAIDEEREDFAPTIWSPKAGVNLKQVWFAGCHGDIGGGNEPDKKTGYQIADTALAWMMGEARAAGLQLESHLSQNLTDGMKGKIHKSRRHIYRLKRPLHRDLTPDDKPTLIHPSVKLRFETDKNYRPKRLVQLLEKIKGDWDRLELGA